MMLAMNRRPSGGKAVSIESSATAAAGCRLSNWRVSDVTSKTIAANQCATGCGRERILPRPKKYTPEEMTSGSKYCSECGKAARSAFRQMVADKRAAQTERFTTFAGLLQSVFSGEGKDFLGNSEWYVRVFPANTSFAYYLLTQARLGQRMPGQSGVLLQMAGEDAASLVAEALDAGLKAIGQTTVNVRYTNKVGQSAAAEPTRPRLQE